MKYESVYEELEREIVKLREFKKAILKIKLEIGLPLGSIWEEVK